MKTFFWCNLQKMSSCVFLQTFDAISWKQRTLGAIFSVCSLPRFLGDFVRIFKDFAQIFRDYARIFNKSKLLGCSCTPLLERHHFELGIMNRAGSIRATLRLPKTWRNIIYTYEHLFRQIQSFLQICFCILAYSHCREYIGRLVSALKTCRWGTWCGDLISSCILENREVAEISNHSLWENFARGTRSSLHFPVLLNLAIF